MKLKLKDIANLDLSYAKELAFKGNSNFDSKPGIEAYKLYAYLSTTFDNGLILDIGTRFGNSALSLSYNETNTVISYNIVEEGASNIERENIIWKIMDFMEDESINYNDVKMILIDVDPHDGNQEPKMISYLKEKSWKGILLLDDIHLNKNMEDFWNTFDDKIKQDVTKYGHLSGTGLVEFK